MTLDRIRNFGIIAHIDAGKTTTTERILFYTSRIHKIGSVDDGTTTTDDYILEQQRGITIFSAAVTTEWKGHTLNLIDTPGHVDFTAEVERSLRVLDGAIVVFDAVTGVEAQSETVWRQANRYGVPRLCYINKMDRVGASFDRSLESIRKRLAARPVVLTFPVGAESNFSAVIDVLKMKLLNFDPDTEGEKITESEIPPDLREEAELWRMQAAEAAAEFDDVLMAKYLEGQALSDAEIRRGLRIGTLAGKINPTYAGSSRHNRGVQPVIDGIVEYLASPLDRPVIEGVDPEGKAAKRDVRKDSHLCALAFKTTTDQHGELTYIRVYTGTLRSGDALFNPRTGKQERSTRLFRMFAHTRDAIDSAGPGEIVAVIGLKVTATGDTLCDKRSPIVLERMHFPEPVVSVAIEPKSSADKDKLDVVLASLSKDDPTFRVTTDTSTGQTMLHCMGELHAEILLFRITNDFKVGAKLREPRVAYKEMLLGSGRGEGTYAQKIGEKSVFGHVVVEASPSKKQVAPRISDERIEYELRKQMARFLPAVRDGLVSAAESGPVAGYPLIYADIDLVGATVTSESSEAAYSAAAVTALRNALAASKATIVEPHMKFEVTVPEAAVGDVINDLNRRGAEIGDLDAVEGAKVVRGNVPLSKMFGYATTLRSITQGRGGYSLEPFEYRPVPEGEQKQRFGDLLS